MLREVAGRIGPAGGGNAVGGGIGCHERPFTNGCLPARRPHDGNCPGRAGGWVGDRGGRPSGWSSVVPTWGPSTPPGAGRPCPCPCQCNFASAVHVARTTQVGWQ